MFKKDIEASPIKLTIIQSILVVIVASILAVSLFQMVGIYYHSIWYQLFATLVISSIVAPIFLYPTFKTSERLRRANTLINKQATTDHLTGLPNMLAFSDRLTETIIELEDQAGFAVHFIDLDRFKQINDTLGHDGGNKLLILAADRLQNYVGSSGFVARFGGDEFVVIQYSVTNEQEASRFAMDLRKVISSSYKVNNEELSVGATIGTALVPQHGTNQDQILKAADMALYKAKEAGTPYCLFDPNIADEALNKIRIEGVLRKAIKNGRLKPFFHSIVRQDNPLRIVGFEALARIEISDDEVLRPDEFIPVAESSGLILELGEYILKQACAECATWNSDIYVAVNVSPVQFMRTDFYKTVQDTLKETGLSANRLELEITESVIIGDISHISSVLSRLRKLGVRIALDDFGSGYCGLHYLRLIEIDKIKIDKSIIDDAGTVLVATNILKSVSHIAKELGLTLTAEGVDTIAKAEYLAAENCAHELQGFLFSRPVPAREAYRMQEFLVQRSPSTEVVPIQKYSNSKKAG